MEMSFAYVPSIVVRCPQVFEIIELRRAHENLLEESSYSFDRDRMRPSEINYARAWLRTCVMICHATTMILTAVSGTASTIRARHD